MRPTVYLVVYTGCSNFLHSFLHFRQIKRPTEAGLGGFCYEVFPTLGYFTRPMRTVSRLRLLFLCLRPGTTSFYAMGIATITFPPTLRLLHCRTVQSNTAPTVESKTGPL